MNDRTHLLYSTILEKLGTLGENFQIIDRREENLDQLIFNSDGLGLNKVASAKEYVILANNCYTLPYLVKLSKQLLKVKTPLKIYLSKYNSKQISVLKNKRFLIVTLCK